MNCFQVAPRRMRYRFTGPSTGWSRVTNPSSASARWANSAPVICAPLVMVSTTSWLPWATPTNLSSGTTTLVRTVAAAPVPVRKREATSASEPACWCNSAMSADGPVMDSVQGLPAARRRNRTPGLGSRGARISRSFLRARLSISRVSHAIWVSSARRAQARAWVGARRACFSMTSSVGSECRLRRAPSTARRWRRRKLVVPK